MTTPRTGFLIRLFFSASLDGCLYIKVRYTPSASRETCYRWTIYLLFLSFFFLDKGSFGVVVVWDLAFFMRGMVVWYVRV